MVQPLVIHTNIKEKLDHYFATNRIPNIIFYGPSGSGKRTLLAEFIQKIYHDNKDHIKSYVMNINCAHGRGIRFVREDLKFFAKTHVNIQGSPGQFKSIILANADKLTMDAQSALRRCIELFSHNTRFFIVTQDKQKLLRPILSRFSEVYVPAPMVDGQPINLYHYALQQTFPFQEHEAKQMAWLKTTLSKALTTFEKTPLEDLGPLLFDTAMKLYEKGYSGIDVMKYMEETTRLDTLVKYRLLLYLHKSKAEFRHEPLFISFILQHLVQPETQTIDLETTSFM